MDAAIKLTDLNAGFEQKVVVEQINATIISGTIAAIAGPNGAGKSTLLKTIARLIPAIGGSVQISGLDAHTIGIVEFSQKIAYVPQDIAHSRDLSVEDLIALGRNPHQKWWQWRAETSDALAIQEAIQATGLSDLASKSLAEISGGERQRAAIAMALAQQPKILLLDEPTAHLDFKHQKSLMELLAKLRDDGMTIVTCLHDLNFIAQICDQVLCLKREQNGASRLLFNGSPQEVLNKDNLRAAFDIDLKIIVDAQDPTEQIRYFGI
ncbi:MAG: ABC transporter ATP-binding protein [Leptolyngbya sp.]|nr:ABC transporter ATP-binding protein [Candidatus Melainabacteria bacterium]